MRRCFATALAESDSRIGKRACGIPALQENSIAASGNRARASTGAIAPSRSRILPAPPGRCTRMRGVKTPDIRFAHPIKRAHIRHQIVVPKGCQFGEEKFFSLPKATSFFRDIAYVPWRKELSLFHIDGAPVPAAAPTVRLPQRNAGIFNPIDFPPRFQLRAANAHRSSPEFEFIPMRPSNSHPSTTSMPR